MKNRQRSNLELKYKIMYPRMWALKVKNSVREIKSLFFVFKFTMDFGAAFPASIDFLDCTIPVTRTTTIRKIHVRARHLESL